LYRDVDLQTNLLEDGSQSLLTSRQFSLLALHLDKKDFPNFMRLQFASVPEISSNISPETEGGRDRTGPNPHTQG
jgi:hypothetical protein